MTPVIIKLVACDSPGVTNKRKPATCIVHISFFKVFPSNIKSNGIIW
jgi:hypothetical protein